MSARPATFLALWLMGKTARVLGRAGHWLPVVMWGGWMLFFALARAVFLLWNNRLAAALPPADIAQTFLYGARLDASLAAYFTLPVAVGQALSAAVGWGRRRRAPSQSDPNRQGRRGGRWVLTAYSGVLLVLSVLAVVVDAELYGHWGFRLDATVFQYLNTPREMAASAGAAPVGWLVALFAGLTAAGAFGYRAVSKWLLASSAPQHPNTQPPPPNTPPPLIPLAWAALLILPMRGGWQQIPINQSSVYFSSRPFANHAAVNVGWNVLYYALRGEKQTNPYEYLPPATARQLVAVPAPSPGPRPDSICILTTRRPNVLVVILESFTGKLVGCVGGEPRVTPALDSAAADGVLFSSIYASGNRSEKGLVSILSGYPAQPSTSISKVPRKAERLPHLAHRLRAAGYRRATYWYGGELAFANMKAYLLAGGYDRLFEKRDFPPALYDAKWGVRDADLLSRLADSLRRQPRPWVSTVFTLSSHEPYDVPGPPAFPGPEETNRFRSAMRYTDAAVSRLLRRLRADRPLWDSTLVVLVADHGHPLPGDTPDWLPARSHIPLLFTGGAVRPAWRGRRLPRIGSQTDVLATVLAQLNLPTADLLPWSRDLLRPTTAPEAFYVFNDGFGLLTPAGLVAYDNVGRRLIVQDGTATAAQLRRGQALMQESFGDFLAR